MRNYLILISLMVFQLIAACNSKQSESERDMGIRPEGLFKFSQKLRGEEMEVSNYIYGAISILCIGNALLISDSDEKFLYQVIDTEKDEIVRGFLSKGNGPCEFQFPTSLQKIKGNRNQIGLSHKRNLTFTWYNLDDITEQTTNCDKTVGRFDINYQKYILIDEKDSLFVGYGLFKNRYVVSDSKGDTLYSFSAYPFMHEFENVPFYHLAMAFQGDIVSHPNLSRFVMTTRRSANLDIIDVRNKEANLIKSYRFWQPKFTFDNENLNVISVDFSHDNEFGFLSTTVNSNYIYTLYSGKSGKNADQGNTVLIFDWEGKPIKSFVLDYQVEYITVDDKGDYLYAYAEKFKPMVLKFRLK